MHINRLTPLAACWFAFASAAPRQNEPRDGAWQNWSSSSITPAATGIASPVSDVASPTSTTSPRTTTDGSQCPPTSDCTSISIHTSITTVTGGSSVVSTVTTIETIGSATTVPTPPDFIPVQSSLPGSSYTGNDSEASTGKRSILAEPGDGILKRPLFSSRSTDEFTGLKKPAYKRETACSAQPTCQTTVITVTSTAMMTEGKSLVTVTSTVTTTTTATTATNTVYAACASNNIADTYPGGLHFLTGSGGYLAVQASNEKTAHDCCVTANHVGAGNSSVWGWEPATGMCNIGLTNSTCPAPKLNPSTIVTGSNGTGVIGNGYCGGFLMAKSQ